MSESRTIRLVILFLLLCVAYGASRQIRVSTDAHLNYLQTRALVLHGDVDLARYAPTEEFVRERDGHVYSIYGIGVSILAAPLFAVLAHLGASASALHAFGSIPFAAAAALATYLLLERLFSKRIALVGLIAFAFGTTMWPIATTAFWQHAEVALLVALGLLAFFGTSPHAPLWSGLAFGTAVFVRPGMAVVLLVVGGYYLVRRRPVRYALGASLPLLAMVIANRWLWDSWLGGYGTAGIGFHGDVARNVPRLLFGWWRGLLPYSPVLVLAFAGMTLAVVRRRDPLAAKMLTLAVACVASIVFYARWTTWWGGANQFGYRYLLDVVPLLVVLAAYAASRLRSARMSFVPLTAVSVATMAAGSAPDEHWWDVDPAVFARTLSESPLGLAWRDVFRNPLPWLSRVALVALVLAAALWTARPRDDVRKPNTVFEI